MLAESAEIASAYTAPEAFGDHDVRAPDASENAASRDRLEPLTLVKSPPAYSVSVEATRLRTGLLTTGLNARTDPVVACTAASSERALPPTRVKAPPT